MRITTQMAPAALLTWSRSAFPGVPGVPGIQVPLGQGGRHCHVQRWTSPHFCENTEFGPRPSDANPDGSWWWSQVIVRSRYHLISPSCCGLKKMPKTSFCEFKFRDPRWTKLVTPCCMASTPSWQKTELEPREPLRNELMKFWGI